RQPRAGARPQLAGVRAGVVGELVVTDAGDVAGDVGLELRADFHGARVGIGAGRYRGRRPDVARTDARRGAGRERPRVVRDHHVAGHVLDAAHTLGTGGAAANRGGVGGRVGQVGGRIERGRAR